MSLNLYPIILIHTTGLVGGMKTVVWFLLLQGMSYSGFTQLVLLTQQYVGRLTST